MMIHPELRAAKAEKALHGYSDYDPFNGLVDLLTDAMHWCDAAGLDFHIALMRAGSHYLHELRDATNDQPERTNP